MLVEDLDFLTWLMGDLGGWLWLLGLLCAVFFLLLNIRPVGAAYPTRRIRQLASGCELLRVFCAVAAIDTVLAIGGLVYCNAQIPKDGTATAGDGLIILIWLMAVIFLVIPAFILFWNGMIRVYLTSVQLGLKHRVLAALCGWIPILNIWYLRKIIRITADEVEFETEKWELDTARAESGSPCWSPRESGASLTGTWWT